MTDFQQMSLTITEAAQKAVRQAVNPYAEYRVWIGGADKYSPTRGETFQDYSEALDYYRDQCTYAKSVRLEGITVLEEKTESV
jgi:hypothetical protein